MTSNVNIPRSAPIKFLCSTCWLVFDNAAARACADCGIAAPSDGWPTLPFVFRDRYLFVEKIGNGTQGAVFKAYDRQAAEPNSESDAWVAVKVLKLNGKENEAFVKEMFRREGRAAAMLSEHPQYFVGFHGSDFNDPACLVLDFVPWPTLKRLHSLNGNFHPLEAARIGVAILRGIRCMERRQMVHRDIKPQNIFARRKEDDSFDVKIADLGIWMEAGSPEESLLGQWQSGGPAGTPQYMSPEQILGELVSTTSDMHAVASVLWQLITGVLPFPLLRFDSAGWATERLKQMATAPPRPGAMPEELYQILTTALQYMPSERAFIDPQTMAGKDNPSNHSDARGMEKALQRFVDEYEDRRKRTLREVFEKKAALEGRLGEGEKKNRHRIGLVQTCARPPKPFEPVWWTFHWL